MPILGTIASSFQSATGDYVWLSTTTMSGSESSVTVSVPSTYKHLQIRSLGRNNRPSTNGPNWVNFNSDLTASNYNIMYFYSGGVSNPMTVSGGNFNSEPGFSLTAAGNTASGGIFGTSVTTILDYNDTDKYKSAISYGSLSNNFSGDETTGTFAFVWRNTNAITSLTFRPFTSPFAANTVFSVYGLKG